MSTAWPPCVVPYGACSSVAAACAVPPMIAVASATAIRPPVIFAPALPCRRQHARLVACTMTFPPAYLAALSVPGPDDGPERSVRCDMPAAADVIKAGGTDGLGSVRGGACVARAAAPGGGCFAGGYFAGGYFAGGHCAGRAVDGGNPLAWAVVANGGSGGFLARLRGLWAGRTVKRASGHTREQQQNAESDDASPGTGVPRQAGPKQPAHRPGIEDESRDEHCRRRAPHPYAPG
jgi:hypothetical protein